MRLGVDAFVAKVEDLVSSGDDAGALSLAHQLVKEYPEEARAWSLRANLLACAEDFAEAITDVTKAINLNSIEPALYFDRGRYELELGDDQSAVQDFTSGLALCDRYNSDYYRETLHFMRAEAFLRLGNKIDGQRDLAQVRDDFSIWTYKLRTKAELLKELGSLSR